MARTQGKAAKRKVEEPAAEEPAAAAERLVRRRVVASEEEALHPIEHASHRKVRAGDERPRRLGPRLSLTVIPGCA